MPCIRTRAICREVGVQLIIQKNEASMSYQVLARKYRPSNFQSLVGQEHVSRALHNALEQQRLHHAYLFTGTRGVGKTTIARILARCLNCETGITATPCGVCSSCVEIAEGRSVDLLEVDAASRTRVEDTRELLENVQYLPTRGPFKVYLIDEVHMLSNHSFNALLKTLEEPPPHVKFLMATTDPKKLPITVLSRCLQFNLKNIPPEIIVTHLSEILGQESPAISFEENALWQIGRAAAGSMRDALSLTDQAISYCDGEVTDEGVKGMLGTIDQMDIFRLVEALISQDAPAAMSHIRDMAAFAPDYAGVLSDLLSTLHRIAVAQLVPDSLDNSQGDEALVRAAAEGLHPDDVQLFYQICLTGSRDLPLSPDPREGFEMVVLRMLAFREASGLPPDDREQPGVAGTEDTKGARQTRESTKARGADEASKSGGASDWRETSIRGTSLSSSGGDFGGFSGRLGSSALSAALEQAEQHPVSTSTPEQVLPPKLVAVPEHVQKTNLSPIRESAEEQPPVHPDGQTAEPSANNAGASVSGATSSMDRNEDPDASSEDTDSVEQIEKTEPLVESPATAPSMTDEGGSADWVSIFKQLAISGVTRTVASHCMVRSIDDNSHWTLIIEQNFSSLLNSTHEKRISDALSEYLERRATVTIEVGAVNIETPEQADAREYKERKLQARDTIMKDDNIQQLIQAFDAELDQDSIEPKQRLGD